MIETARIAAGLTQGKLAQDLEVSQPFISQVERGVRPMPQDLAERWAEVCDTTPDLLLTSTRALGDGVADGLHRARRTVPAKPFRSAQATVNILRMRLGRLLDEVHLLPSLGLPNLDDDTSPEQAAAAVRLAWRVAAGPFPDLTAHIEATGTPVVHLGHFHAKHSAMTLPGTSTDWVVVVNAALPASVLRFTLAHELGHIVLRHDLAGAAGRDLENEADRFAAELLMPARDIRPELRSVTFPKLGLLKRRYRVSMAALIIRARDLDLISGDTVRKWFIRLSSQPGGRKNESDEFKPETPTLVRHAVEVLRTDGYSDDDIASLTFFRTAADMREGLLGEAPPVRIAKPHAPADRPHLQLVRP